MLLLPNRGRHHQALGYLTPAEVFISSLAATREALVESLVPGPQRTAGATLDTAPILS